MLEREWNLSSCPAQAPFTLLHNLPSDTHLKNGTPFALYEYNKTKINNKRIKICEKAGGSLWQRDY